MRGRSLRFRLTVWYAAVLTAALVALGLLLFFAVRHELIAEIDSDLEGRAGRFESYFRAEWAEAPGQAQVRDELDEFCQALPVGSSILLQGASGFRYVYPAGKAEGAQNSQTLRRAFTMNGEKFRLETGEPLNAMGHTLRLLATMLMALIPFVIAIASVGGAWLARRALMPVRNLTEAARSIGIENLSERLTNPGTGDELAQLTEVLNSMLARLESAVQALSQFSADASHELRTPLAVIRTTAELALRRARPVESYRESLAGVAAEAERMTQLVEELLALARSGARAVEMPREAVDVREVARTVCEEIRELAEIRRIVLNISLGNDPAIISGNRPALHRLFIALLDNALKFSAAESVVNLALRRAEGRVTVSVQDFGCGIGSADLPHIFKRFYRADAFGKEGAGNRGGFGLGLPLAEAIAQAHHAKIEVHSVEGAGSTFQVIFPERVETPVVIEVPSGNLQPHEIS